VSRPGLDQPGERPRSDGGARPVVALRLIGGFDLTVDRTSVPLPEGAAKLLAFLATQRARLDRSFIAGTLWPELVEERARGNLRTALWRLKSIGGSPVESDGRRIGLAPDVAVDLHQAEQVGLRLLRDPALATLTDCRHTGLYGDVLPDWYSDWAALERERFRHLRVHALEAASRYLRLVGLHGEAVQAAVAATYAEPLRESAQRELMEVHLAAGNGPCALRQFESFRALLRRELGVEPSEQMEMLLRGVREVWPQSRVEVSGSR